MASLVIVSGCPGSGKTTLAASLAREATKGLHIESDVFYGFPAKPINPTEPDANRQNGVIMTALGRSSGAFLEGGYDVFLEGVVGPWFLPRVLAELPRHQEVSYLLLRVPESEALRRVREREGAGRSPMVRAMAPAFSDLGTFETHVVSTLEKEPQAVLAEVSQGLQQGRFRLRA